MPNVILRAPDRQTVVERARKYIDRMPAAVSGQGGHDAAFSVARVLVTGFALSDGDALALLREWNPRCQPPWSERELAHKVSSARSTPSTNAHGYLLGDTGHQFPTVTLSAPPPPKPEPPPPVDPIKRVEHYLGGFRCTLADASRVSPVPMPADWRQGGALLVRELYGPDEHINVVRSFTLGDDGKARPQGKGVSYTRDVLANRLGTCFESQAGAWLRMNPVDGKGVGDENVTACRWALVESDALPLDLQVALLAKLPAPIGALITSGSRSLHAWVRLDAPDADTGRAMLHRLRDLMEPFGMDKRNATVSRLSRLPGAVRKVGAVDGGEQRLVYLNPAAANMKGIL
jgi:hypothetical protein